MVLFTSLNRYDDDIGTTDPGLMAPTDTSNNSHDADGNNGSSSQLSSIPSITVHQYKRRAFDEQQAHVLLDVRTQVQYEMVNMATYMNPDGGTDPGAEDRLCLNASKINILHVPLDTLLSSPEALESLIGENSENSENSEKEDEGSNDDDNGDIRKLRHIYVVCRRGVASRKATEYLRQQGYGNVYSIEGGLTVWTREVDPAFPKY